MHKDENPEDFVLDDATLVHLACHTNHADLYGGECTPQAILDSFEVYFCGNLHESCYQSCVHTFRLYADRQSKRSISPSPRFSRLWKNCFPFKTTSLSRRLRTAFAESLIEIQIQFSLRNGADVEKRSTTGESKWGKWTEWVEWDAKPSSGNKLCFHHSKDKPSENVCVVYKLFQQSFFSIVFFENCVKNKLDSKNAHLWMTFLINTIPQSSRIHYQITFSFLRIILFSKTVSVSKKNTDWFSELCVNYSERTSKIIGDNLHFRYNLLSQNISILDTP